MSCNFSSGISKYHQVGLTLIKESVRVNVFLQINSSREWLNGKKQPNLSLVLNPWRYAQMPRLVSDTVSLRFLFDWIIYVEIVKLIYTYY